MFKRRISATGLDEIKAFCILLSSSSIRSEYTLVKGQKLLNGYIKISCVSVMLFCHLKINESKCTDREFLIRLYVILLSNKRISQLGMTFVFTTFNGLLILKLICIIPDISFLKFFYDFKALNHEYKHVLK